MTNRFIHYRSDLSPGPEEPLPELSPVISPGGVSVTSRNRYGNCLLALWEVVSDFREVRCRLPGSVLGCSGKCSGMFRENFREMFFDFRENFREMFIWESKREFLDTCQKTMSPRRDLVISGKWFWDIREIFREMFLWFPGNRVWTSGKIKKNSGYRVEKFLKDMFLEVQNEKCS